MVIKNFDKEFYKKGVSKWKIFFMLFLTISLIFITPYFIRSSFAQPQKVSSCAITLDVRKSLIFSIFTLCFPGILNRLHDWREIKCEYAKCYYDAVVHGIDPTYCKTIENYNTCVFILQEGLLDQIVDKFRAVMDAFFRDPIGFIMGIGLTALRCSAKSACCGSPSPSRTCALLGKAGLSLSASPAACNYLAASLAAVDVPNSYARIKELFEAKGLLNFGTKSACDDLKDIKSKLDKIKKGLTYEEVKR